MWEVIVTVLVVAIALYFTGRSLFKNLNGKDGGTCSGGCGGCPSMSKCNIDIK